MIFNSIPFLVFFSVFFLFYWFVFARNLRFQNLFLLAGSYFFYAWWDSRFLSLLVGSSLLNYVLGILISESKDQKRKSVFVFIGLLQGLGCLIVFKYLDFFIGSMAKLLSGIGLDAHIQTLGLILPLGISFYTFRMISYLLDLNNGKTQAIRDWSVFFNYVSFFPSLISGPIDKVNLLVPQLNKEKTFKYEQAVDGMQQILWGLFKKVVIADNCAALTNEVFDNYESLPASSLLIGVFFYTIQIYADFSGYSDMAIGIAKLLGFTITRNFDFPFFAQNIAEFWRKWHISLTNWLTEYVFTPLSIAFRDYGKLGVIAAILINFTLIGIWHGANWTFILFGFLHGCYFIPLILNGTINKRKKPAKNKFLPGFKELSNMIGTFLLVTLTFVLFRSYTIGDAVDYYKSLFAKTIVSKPVFGKAISLWVLLFFSIVLLVTEWIQRDKEHALQFKNGELSRPLLSKSLRWMAYVFILYTILIFKSGQQNFIYFNF